MVFHRTRIGKCAMKKFCINCQFRNTLVLIVTHRFSLVIAAMNAPLLCKLSKDCHTGTGHGAMVFTKRLNLLIFQLPKVEQKPMHTCQLVAKLAIKKQGAL
jgi:hypothetical protein